RQRSDTAHSKRRRLSAFRFSRRALALLSSCFAPNGVARLDQAVRRRAVGFGEKKGSLCILARRFAGRFCGKGRRTGSLRGDLARRRSNRQNLFACRRNSEFDSTKVVTGRRESRVYIGRRK